MIVSHLHLFFRQTRCFWLAWVVVLAHLARAETWPTEAERLAAYQARCDYLVEQTLATTDPDDLNRGGLFQIAINLHEGENIEWARARLRAVNDPPSGA